MTTNFANTLKALSDAFKRAFPSILTVEMHDVMVDLETTGTGPDAAIASIGAVAFNREAGVLGPTFYKTIALESSVQAGGQIDASTFKWWMQQSEEARSAFAGGDHINIVLLEFANWLQEHCGQKSDVRIWGNGADFDPVLLSESYKRSTLPRPWEFWNVRCFRTLRNEHRHIKFNRVGTHHNALDDAISQAQHLLKIDAKNHTIESNHE